MSQASGSLTAPKEGADARVGAEMGMGMGWLMRRIKLAQELVAQPEVLELADRVAERMDRWALIHGERIQDLSVETLHSFTKSQMRIVWGGAPCIHCDGTGRSETTYYCSACGGSGLR